MKTTLLTLTFIGFLSTAGITGCNFTTEQKTETPEEVITNMAQTREDSTDFANYKVESEIKLKSNDLLIADMKDRMKVVQQETRVQYIKSLDSLEEQNSRLRNNIKTYNSAGKENWEKFKQGFNQELDALGKSISQLAEKNMKKGS